MSPVDTENLSKYEKQHPEIYGTNIHEIAEHWAELQAQARFDAWWKKWKPLVVGILIVCAACCVAICISAVMALIEMQWPGVFPLDR